MAMGTGSISPSCTTCFSPLANRTQARSLSSSLMIIAVWTPRTFTSLSMANSPTASCGAALSTERFRWSAYTLNSFDRLVASTSAMVFGPHSSPGGPGKIRIIVPVSCACSPTSTLT